MTDEEIGKALKDYSKVAVIGISSNPERPSHRVSQYLIEKGYTLVGVNPKESEILGCPVFSTIKDVPEPLEIVDVFRASAFIPEIVESLIPLKPKVIWLQEGVSHPEAEAKARRAGIMVISDLCIKKEHARLL